MASGSFKRGSEMDEWDKKGCATCRSKWLSGEGLKKLGISDERHASLHYCDRCNTFWEQYERYVDTISEAEAATIYGKETVSSRLELQSSFEPQNPLEASLIDSQRGRIPFTEFLEQMLNSEVFVLSKDEADGNSFNLIQYERSGEVYVAVFTSLERTLRVAKQFPYCLSIRASELLTRINPRVGIVLNPGWSVGFELPATGLEGIRRDFLD